MKSLVVRLTMVLLMLVTLPVACSEKTQQPVLEPVLTLPPQDYSGGNVPALVKTEPSAISTSMNPIGFQVTPVNPVLGSTYEGDVITLEESEQRLADNIPINNAVIYDNEMGVLAVYVNNGINVTPKTVTNDYYPQDASDF